MTGRRAFLWAWIITSLMITWGAFTKCKPPQLPWPPRFIFAAMAFGILDIFSVLQEELAGVIAIGIVLAAIVQNVNPSSTCIRGFCTDCSHQGTGQTDATVLAEFTQSPAQNPITPPSTTPQQGTTIPPGSTLA